MTLYDSGRANVSGCFSKEIAHHGASSYPWYDSQFLCKAVTCYPGAPAPLHGKLSGSKHPQAAAGPGLANSGAKPPQVSHGLTAQDRIWDETLALCSLSWAALYRAGEHGVSSSSSVRLLQTLTFRSYFGERSDSSAVRGHSPLGFL